MNTAPELLISTTQPTASDTTRNPTRENIIYHKKQNTISLNTGPIHEGLVVQAWNQMLEIIKSEVGQHAFSAYFEPLIVELANSDSGEFGETILTISAPSRLQCQLIERNYAQRIESLLKELLKTTNLTLTFVVQELRTTNESPPTSQFDSASRTVIKRRSTPPSAELAESSNSNEHNIINNLNPKYTFQSFVVGSNNQFCNAAACRVAEQPGESYNPLFIYGGVGLGKTHLLHSIGNAALSRNPNAKVLYISSEAFTNELIQALRNAKMEEFKSRLRSIEILLIDDIQFISGKERTQEEFFHTFNALYSCKRQIVMTSDKIPSEIDGIEERLQTRFAWGLTADLQAPDFETRAAILKRKALLENFHLPEDVAHLIAENISSNVRELEGALTRLHAVSSLQKVPITLQMAQASLKPLLEPKKISVNIDDIKKAVAQHFSIKVSEIVSKRRTKNLSFPRHVAMYLCRKHTTASYPEIGEKFGGRDHSSVIHAASVVANKVSDETSVRELVSEIERKLFN